MGAREYAQGDSFRHIHWKATARRQSLQTKVFEPSNSRPLALFLNVNTHANYSDGYDSELREFAICAAASITRQVWADGQAVGLFTNALMPGAGSPIRIRPRQDAGQLIRMLEALAYIDGFGRWPIETLLRAESSSLPYGSTVVVISALVSPHLRQMLLDLRRRDYGVSLVTLGDGQLEKPMPGIFHRHIGAHEEWHDLDALELA
ncbi:MAG: DUF58 domain-containing protein [Caldilineaceae bacterium]|nr:DUF58 domain-containing protein [Caldilineaceae bacterium]